MEQGFGIVDPEATLYRAARLWGRAGQEWEAAAARLDDAVLGGVDLGPAFRPHGDDFARAYGACLWALREQLVSGAEAMRDAARQLERSAGEHIEADEDIAGRIARLADRLAGRG